MRALKYKLADGTIVNTMSQAKASGQEYEVFMEEVRETKRKRESLTNSQSNAWVVWLCSPKPQGQSSSWLAAAPLKNGGVFFMLKISAPRAALASGILLYYTPLHLSRAKMHKFLKNLLSHFVHFAYWQTLVAACQ